METIDRIESLEYRLLNAQRRIQLGNANLYLSDGIINNDRESLLHAMRIISNILSDAQSARYELTDLENGR